MKDAGHILRVNVAERRRKRKSHPTTPASDVRERLKTNGTAIKIAKETTNNQ